MDIARPTRRRLAWIYTLKFQIVAIAVAAAAAAAVVTAHFAFVTTESNMEQILVQGEGEDAERTATLLGTKVDMLRDALKAAARQSPDEMWTDPEAMRQYLLANAALGSLFEGVLAARSSGDLLGRVSLGKLSSDLPNIRDRTYFQQALKTDQPVISEPLAAKRVNTPVVVMAISVRGAGGEVLGVLAGVLALNSNNLFSAAARTVREKASRVLVMNRQGVLMAHTDPVRLLGRAADEQGLTDAFELWRASGSSIDTIARTTLSRGHLVAMAGIPDTDWTLVRLTPLAVVLAPLASARKTAWRSAAWVALAVAALSGGLAWLITRPISRLRSRANLLLSEGDFSAEDWPRGHGEVGQLGRAFARVVEQRHQKQEETDALLSQIEAVLDHADIGIALTREGRFEMVSREFCEVFGLKRGDLVGRPASTIYPTQEAYDELSARAGPAFMRDGAFNGEVELMRSEGKVFWARLRGRAVAPGDRSKGTIWTVEDVTASRAQRERLTWTSSHDSLTGLANRAAFEEMLEAATARAVDEPFCAMFIDLDHFKQVNDTGGHSAGDALLRDVASALAGQVRLADTVARLGGDEFAILLRGCALPSATEVAEKLRLAVEAYRLVWNGHSFGVGASIGVVAVDASFKDAAAVLSAADSACYAAKARGRNAVAVFRA
ncbi:diguanylate cyclase [Variovorax sp. H27-G14]|uniref:sensor domain-containing diguanylate cyclase n=1 Tax=Variovorax sp. H27-G14 TaxID=3111914 RepID=UPI0038FC779A